MGIAGGRLGIVGGLGPETGSLFLLHINQKIKERTGSQPDVVLENVPVPHDVETDMISGRISSEMRSLLLEAVRRLNASGADCIVIPCNSVHAFIDDVRKASKKPVLNIVEECAKVCKRDGFKKVGILGTATTVRQNLHAVELGKQGIQTIVPDDADQEAVTNSIQKILDNKITTEDKQTLQRIIGKMKDAGSEAVILACTDLRLMLTKEDAALPLIDTTEILEDAAVMRMLEVEK